MRRVLRVLAAALACAFPAGASAQAPGDSVTGALLDPADYRGVVDAHSGPFGEDPTGTARLGSSGIFAPVWELDVTCLSVTGNTAVVGFSGTVAIIFDFVEVRPTAGLIRVVDGGGPASRQDSLEFVSVEGAIDGPPIPGPTSCATYPADFPLRHGPIVNGEGDLVVTDSQPVPTSTSQCKTGGWRTFGVFKNQGDCASFVATGGRDTPAGGP